MRRLLTRISSIVFLAVVLLSLSVPVFAADSIVAFKGAAEGFGSPVDLFNSFKGVMPGDRLTQNIQIKNEAADCDYINVYVRAAAQDETDAAGQKFLSQLTMRVYNGDQLISEASPDKAGALTQNVLLGTLRSGESLNLKAELDIPVELGNEYVNSTGKVNWIFLAECIEYEKLTVHNVWKDNGYPDRPDSVKVQLFRDGKLEEEVELNEENQWTYTWDDLDDRYQWTVELLVPEGYGAAYKSEDNRIFITSSMDYEPEVPEEPVNLTVKKVWSDEDDRREIRPDSVTVTLYNGENAVEKVALHDGNNWTYAWTDLDGTGDWSVLETGIPNGYTPSYRTSGETVTITNTVSLIQTGQLNWPIPVLGSLGVLMIFFGIMIMRKKKQNGDA